MIFNPATLDVSASGIPRNVPDLIRAGFNNLAELLGLR